MKSINFLIIIAFLLFLIIISLLTILSRKPTKMSEEILNLPVYNLSKKPSLSGIIVKNPDLLFQEKGYLSEEDREKEYPVIHQADWKSNGFAGPGWPSLGREGIVLLHPPSTTKSAYLQQRIYLPNTSSNYYLVLGIANIAKMEFGMVGCEDNIFRVYLQPTEEEKSYKILEREVNADEGWMDLGIDISPFKGKELIVRVESVAGGRCREWYGEYGAVDYIDILTNLSS